MKKSVSVINPSQHIQSKILTGFAKFDNIKIKKKDIKHNYRSKSAREPFELTEQEKGNIFMPESTSKFLQ